MMEISAIGLRLTRGRFKPHVDVVGVSFSARAGSATPGLRLHGSMMEVSKPYLQCSAGHGSGYSLQLVKLGVVKVRRRLPDCHIQKVLWSLLQAIRYRRSKSRWLCKHDAKHLVFIFIPAS